MSGSDFLVEPECIIKKIFRNTWGGNHDFSFLSFSFMTKALALAGHILQKCDHNATWEAIAVNTGKYDFPLIYPIAALTFSDMATWK